MPSLPVPSQVETLVVRVLCIAVEKGCGEGASAKHEKSVQTQAASRSPELGCGVQLVYQEVINMTRRLGLLALPCYLS